MISVIITSFNEGDEVKNTIDSVFANTSDVEIILVDDASEDGSCDPWCCYDTGGAVDGVTVVRHDERIGIAASRNDGVAMAKGDVYAFLDAHQRVDEGCLNKCAQVARERQSIVWPCLTGLPPKGERESRWMGHGARMRQKRGGAKNGLFDGQWKRRPGNLPSDDEVYMGPDGVDDTYIADGAPLSRCSTMIVPGYVVPKTVWPKLKLIDGLRCHGASEPAMTVKAFFADVPILHLCGPVCRHRFTPGHRLPYPCPWWKVARNHAMVARVCFEQKTWDEYWFPKVFRRHLRKREGLIEEFEAGPIVDQQREFEKIKQRPDDEFWRGLIQEERA